MGCAMTTRLRLKTVLPNTDSGDNHSNMIRILHRTNDPNRNRDNDRASGSAATVTEGFTVEDLPRLLGDKSSMTWVDLFDPEMPTGAQTNEGQTQLTTLLSGVFGFHPLSIEDALSESHVPKVDDWGSYVYIVLHAVRFDASMDDVDTNEVDIFLGQNFLVTHHTEDIAALERQWRNVLRDERHTRRGPDYCLYELCDAIAADYMPCMDAMDEIIDRIEDQVFDKPEPRTVGKIFKLKSAVLNLRRVLSPQREVFNKLARDDYAVIDAKDRIYFRDVYDHFVRLADLNESLRDLVSGALDTYLSVAANRTNDIMKTLTIVTVLFMPLAFFTSFFGMNFFGGLIELRPDSPPEKWLFFALSMLVMFGVPLFLFQFIRRRGWWK